MSDEIKELRSLIETASIHTDRMAASLKKMESFFPLTPEILENLSLEYFGYLEMVTTRFSKLQDVMGAKIFPLILEILGVNIKGLSPIDILNHFEKLEFIKDAQIWNNMRKIRNKVTHEYPDDPMERAQNLMEIIEQARVLLDYWIFLKTKIEQRVFQNTLKKS